MFRRGDRDHAKQRRRLLLYRDALELDILRQLGQGNLDAVVDVDGVDVRVGTELEGAGQRVAAVIAAHALHVDHLVDADDLRLDRLCDGRVNDGGIGSRIEGRDRDLGGNDIRVLRNRDRKKRQKTGDRRHDGDDDREPRPVDEDGGEHRISSF
jgi:hypothetical protein